mmetsp:Transcript_8578/g.28234  ORF Transcript_8578/g.28234 Transcript_8578/m.28234 type:complete len:214 (+) Transcript_8578:778-1419(+)
MDKYDTTWIVAANRYVMYDRSRAKILRDSTTAPKMAERPGDVKTIAAAFLAASVAPSTAMPHCAADSAGASLTPSPVMPTMRSWSVCSRWTISRLSRGKTCAKPDAWRMRFDVVTSAPRHDSAEKTSMASRPMRRHVSFATFKWSPVIIFTSTPAPFSDSIVDMVSKRGGSSMGSRPQNSIGPSPLRTATAMVLYPAFESLKSASLTCFETAA